MGHFGRGGTTTELIVPTLPPAGYAYEDAQSVPHTVMPNAPELDALCVPFVHVPTPTFPRMISAVVIWKRPLVPTSFHPVTLPRQSIETSWKPPPSLTRTRAKFVVQYVGSVKKTYFWRNYAGGSTLTMSGPPRHWS